jgi:hypothetical protein
VTPSLLLLDVDGVLNALADDGGGGVRDDVLADAVRPPSHTIPGMADWSDLVLSNTTPPRVGRVVVDDGAQIEVAWSDGRRTSHGRSAGAVRRILPGSPEEMYAQDVEAFEKLLAGDAVELFLAAMRTARAGDVKANELQERLIGLGIDPTVVKAAWNKSKPKLDKHAHIIRDVPRRTYRWSTSAVDPIAWVDTLSRLDSLLALSRDKLGSAERDRLVARTVAATEAPLSGDEVLLAWGLDLPNAPTPTEAPEHLDERALGVVLTKARKVADQAILALLAQTRGSSRVATSALSALTPPARTALAEAAAQRLSRGASSASAALLLLDRMSRSEEGLPPTVLPELLRCRLGMCPGGDGDWVGQLDVLLTREGVTVASLRQLLAGDDGWDGTACRVGELRRGSFRLLILTAMLGTPHETVLEDPRTWDGLDLATAAELIGAGHPLTGILCERQDGIASRMAMQYVTSTEPTAQALAQVLTWPKSLQRSVPIGSLQAFVQRARQTDDLLGSLLSEDRTDLEEAFEIAAAARDHAEARLRAEEERHMSSVKAALNRAEAAEQRLRDVFNTSGDSRRSELRQAQLDVIRVLCGALDEVFVAERVPQGGPAWWAAVEAASSIGIRVIGSADQPATLDPRTCEGIDVPPGGQGIVRRPGYEWAATAEQVVIRRAVLTPRTGSVEAHLGS